MPEMDPAQMTSVAAERRAREFLANGHWRKARDELKPLVKLERTRYLPLLILANVGLAREMQAKGQIADAQQVLSYLATIASPNQIREAEAQLMAKNEPAPTDLSPLANALSQPGLPEEEKLRVADQLVIGFQPLTSEEPALAGVATELKAVHDGLVALSLQKWEQLPDILRLIPHRSVFAHWTMFIKGVAAFHTKDGDRAVRFLTSLPANSVPAKASQSYLLFLEKAELPKKDHTLSAIVLEGACRLLGQPGTGRALLEADQLWKKGRRAESYKVLRSALSAFPSRDINWLGALTDFYFNSPYMLPEHEQEEYTDAFDGLRARRETKSLLEDMLIHRMFALNGDDRTEWDAYVRLYQHLNEPNPRFVSMAYTQLGTRLAQVNRSGFAFFRPEPVDADGAIEYLQKATRLDPDNLDAHLALAKLYETLSKRAELNRLFDQMVQRFPEEKRVLLGAAIGCIERNAYIKGLDYLARARSLDQLDPQIPEVMVSTRRKLALQYFQQGRVEKARQNLALNEENLTNKPDDFQRSRWTARLRHGLMEQKWGDPAIGNTLVVEARGASPSLAAFLLFGHLADRATDPRLGKATQFWSDLGKELKSSPAVSQVALLLRIFDFWQSLGVEMDSEEGLLRKYLKAAIQKPFTRDEARPTIELRLDHPRWRPELRALIKKVLRTDALDPLFRLYEVLLETKRGFPPFSHRQKLETILQEAARRGDEATAQRTRQVIKRLDSPPPMPLPPFLGPDFDDEDDLDELFGAGDPFPDIPPQAQAELMQLLSLLRGMSKAELQEARRSRPHGMPVEVFDMLIQLAETGELPPPFPFPPPRPGPRRR